MTDITYLISRTDECVGLIALDIKKGARLAGPLQVVPGRPDTSGGHRRLLAAMRLAIMVLMPMLSSTTP
ncbi:hypothetical protein BJ999_004195 [Actinomadura citrea]|uniref:Uncharacterized protein n=1 Tax=Actinomadura citrea TaxID=46158 RepID=A0A7Y9KFR0_9ACTN|nr:hypothetical protein [Actinomadura citrea]